MTVPTLPFLLSDLCCKVDGPTGALGEEDDIVASRGRERGERIGSLVDRFAGPSICYSIPCCFLSCSKLSLRASMSSFDRTILSGWWYSTADGSQRWSCDWGLAVHTNEIAILKVEAVQLIARLLCIHYVLIDHEGSALGIVCDSLADLAAIDQYCWLSRMEDACGVEPTGWDRTCQTDRRVPRLRRCSCFPVSIPSLSPYLVISSICHCCLGAFRRTLDS